MIVVALQGGLGNQMFQYAVGRRLSLQWKCPLYFDLEFFRKPFESGITPRKMELDIFNISIEEVSPEMRKKFETPDRLNAVKKKLHLPHYKRFAEPALNFQSELLRIKPPIYLQGFFQSEKYFEQIRTELQSDFSFDKLIDERNLSLAREMGSGDTVSVHVRRGDFLNAKNQGLHGVCSLDYYREAIGRFQAKRNNPVFYFFTDDAAWVNENVVPFAGRSQVIVHNTGNDSWKDIYLMSRCKDHIIANSSFSWWGAWLNAERDGEVVAPAHWFVSDQGYWNYHDLVPERWIKVKND